MYSAAICGLPTACLSKQSKKKKKKKKKGTKEKKGKRGRANMPVAFTLASYSVHCFDV
jgi:hypothetical protein